jgi:hypothetical protein
MGDVREVAQPQLGGRTLVGGSGGDALGIGTGATGGSDQGQDRYGRRQQSRPVAGANTERDTRRNASGPRSPNAADPEAATRADPEAGTGADPGVGTGAKSGVGIRAEPGVGMPAEPGAGLRKGARAGVRAARKRRRFTG